MFRAVTCRFHSVLEGDLLLDLPSSVHLFCCHHVFIPRLQAQLDLIRDGWDNHPLSIERNLNANHMWHMGLQLWRVQWWDTYLWIIVEKAYICGRKNNDYLAYRICTSLWLTGKGVVLYPVIPTVVSMSLRLTALWDPMTWLYLLLMQTQWDTQHAWK